MSLLMRKRGLDSIGLRRPTRRVALAIGALVVAAGLAAGAQGAYADSKPLVIARDTGDQLARSDPCLLRHLPDLSERDLRGPGFVGADNKTMTPKLADSWEAMPTRPSSPSISSRCNLFRRSPVEAKDVKWTFERLKNLKADASSSWTG